MQRYRLALIGFGNVGQGFTQILRDKGEQLARRFDVQFQIVAISDLLKGSLYNPDGLDATALLEAIQNTGRIQDLPALHQGWDALKTIEETNADAVIEISYTDLKTGEPALTHIRTALERGKHVVTTNKGPIALHYPELAALAREKGAEIGVEGTVMSGTPALRVGQELLGGTSISKVQGILNGTTNYILTQMENGASYQHALAQAQEHGYAEADPSGDVEGHDAAGKVVILANLLMETPLTMADVSCQGITQVTPADIAEASAAGERWKLIGTVEQTGHGVEASVKPLRVPLSHPLASISGATNAITYTTDLLDEVTLVGPGAGRLETGYALLGDLLAIHRNSK